ncbi:N-acetyl-gamma-glutamyl-phosphate reductase [Microbacterium laevaniformans]|uniref:N-acetyl-gamma-glutamyl-phosphate reductase n=1 Tax=Microbacterium TaxID=33882 RepID=UPI00095C5A58|nr:MULTISPECIES: N-acetyl-gamma-glutamyl-phosphate reductase [Microbacterium]MBM7752030.1 N-acetyl-gamma-glutamyl-phosphate reductase [Microbacterium laevaniformans]OJU46261.1 MAG: N-acetyl-gamma-glutamyl-phosphate reductase [Microbacterium sp. 69-7]GLJ65064.1 N-acetyl-gamma-glutamyl-phosphate reductase [Microbacterium laevaniformans]
MTLSVAVSGASGYAGGEILRLLAAHPDVHIRTVTAHSNAGDALIQHQPHLRSLADLTLQPTTPEVLAGHDVVFLALPHGQSGQYTDALADTPLVIDAGADHRLISPAAWDAFYGGAFHEPWTYGVPELIVGAGGQKQREHLVGASRIAAPGCNASTVALSLVPGVAAGVIDARDIVSVLAVGSSGAGKSLKTNLLASEILGTANPYAVGGTHRHIPEIQQALAAAGAPDARVSFTPVLVPMARGILATSTAPIVDGVTDAEIRSAWESAYDGETFVQLLPEGQFPRTADVLGANTALVGLAVDRAANRVVVVTAVDNLVKGTAGAAIQSMNIALGLPEATGLTVNGVAP